jgi:hypothetical protein
LRLPARATARVRPYRRLLRRYYLIDARCLRRCTTPAAAIKPTRATWFPLSASGLRHVHLSMMLPNGNQPAGLLSITTLTLSIKQKLPRHIGHLGSFQTGQVASLLPGHLTSPVRLKDVFDRWRPVPCPGRVIVDVNSTYEIDAFHQRTLHLSRNLVAGGYA